MSKAKLLTQVEQEFMLILWKLGEGTVHDILRELPEDRDLAYTSVSTILRILEDKNILSTRKVGRQHIYTPLLPKKEYDERTLSDVISANFDGKIVNLVNCLLDEDRLSVSEIKQIQEILQERELQTEYD
jgi:predicted transcriptional regulator